MAWPETLLSRPCTKARNASSEYSAALRNFCRKISPQSSTLRPPCHPWKISRLVRLQLVQEPQALPIDTSSLVTQNWCTNADDLDMTRLTDLFIITYHSSHCWGIIRGVSWYFQFSHTFPGRKSVKIAKTRDSLPHYPHSARSVPVGRPLKRQFNGLA